MKYFTISELTYSDKARELHIDNTPFSLTIIDNLTDLTENLLDPIREAWGKPLHVNSGYRCPALNKAVGGKPTSQHLKGEAVDITTGSKGENMKLFEMIKDSGLVYDQLIDEYGFSWIHISLKKDGKNRKQIVVVK